MASVGQLAKLFQALAVGDVTTAQQGAGEIIATEERLGHHAAAKTLRGSLWPNQPKPAIASVIRSSLIQEALTAITPPLPLDGVQLRPSIRETLDELRLEWMHRVELSAAGIPRRSRLLFHGPPGCGKSLTAAAFATHLGLPAYVVRFDAVVGAYLGQTAVHLRELFRFAEVTPCILLVDEIDALGKHRGDPLDVGELHRIVITLMQELEHVQPAGYLIATSNLPKQLDAALWRRFDLIVEFPRPDARERERFAVSRAKALGVKFSTELRALARKAASFADVEKLILVEARRSLIARKERPGYAR